MLLCKLGYTICFAIIAFIGFYFGLVLLIIIKFIVSTCVLLLWSPNLITPHFILIPSYHSLLDVSFIYSVHVLTTRFSMHAF